MMKVWSIRSLICWVIIFLLTKGQHVRSQTTSICIQPFLDDNGDVIIVADCICDPTCEVCGYYGEAVSGPEDCFTCPVGFLHTEVFDDGSGTCTTSDNAGTTLSPSIVTTEAPTETGTASSPPGTGTGGSSSTSGGICMMIYQMADNDLESFLREDLSEITISPIAQSASTTTWIYHDGLDSGDANYTGGPLPDIYNPDGSVSTESSSASRYLNWDHDLGKMVVNTTFSSELNSDSPAVLEAFLTSALADCVERGKSEYFLAFSSHGAGFAGFGGDNDNEKRRRRLRRKLIQSTADMVSAVQGALSSISGAPSQLDVVGFDSCLMQSMDAIDDFASITRYYLASEAVEPVHGWAYNELSATTSAIDLAVDVVDTFVSSLHNNLKHDTPKTLAVVDTTAFSAFRDAWDALCSEMADILGSGNDADFHVSLLRARGNTLSFSGYLDYPSIQVNSAMDIGDFLARLFQLCEPIESSQLYTLMNNAYDAYNAMFVVAKLGPGTPSGTGMYITWVSKQEYVNYQEIYQEIIFPATGSFPLKGAPNYSRLLALYYNTSTPADNVDTSVCGTTTGSSSSVESPSDLLINPNIFFVDATTTELRSEITQSVDYVLVQFGMDVTHFLQDAALRRHLHKSSHHAQARRLDLGGGGTKRLPSFARRHQAIKGRYLDTNDRTRRLEQDGGNEDYFYIYGGNVDVGYDGSTIVASWDSTFFWIESGEDLEPVYANDYGGGLKSIPVCFFDQNHPVTSEQIPLGVTVDYAITNLGCQEGYLSFSAAEDSDGDINLYVYKGNILSEVTVAAGRSIVPILYIDLVVGGERLTELLGGLNSTVVPWTPESNIAVYAFSDSLNLDLFESDTAFLQIYAYDDDLKVSDVSTLAYSFSGNTEGSQNPSHNSDPSGTPDTNEDPADDSSASSNGDVPDESSSNRIMNVGIAALFLIWTAMIFGSS